MIFVSVIIAWTPWYVCSKYYKRLFTKKLECWSDGIISGTLNRNLDLVASYLQHYKGSGYMFRLNPFEYKYKKSLVELIKSGDVDFILFFIQHRVIDDTNASEVVYLAIEYNQKYIVQLFITHYPHILSYMKPRFKNPGYQSHIFLAARNGLTFLVDLKEFLIGYFK